MRRLFVIQVLCVVDDDAVRLEDLYALVPTISRPGIQEVYADISPDPAKDAPQLLESARNSGALPDQEDLEER